MAADFLFSSVLQNFASLTDDTNVPSSECPGSWMCLEKCPAWTSRGSKERKSHVPTMLFRYLEGDAQKGNPCASD